MNSSPAPIGQLSISIVLYNSAIPLLELTLDSLHRAVQAATDAKLLSSAVLVLVDNSSTPVYSAAVKTLLGRWASVPKFRIEYIEVGENRGYGAGHNVALKMLHSDIHLILNPDAELDQSALTVGLQCFENDPGAVLLSPQVSGNNGAQEFLCKRYPSFLVLLLRAFSPRLVRRLFRKPLHDYEMRDSCAGEQPADVLLASGCFMLVRTEALQSIGGFDDDYFLYFEDFDLSIRLAGKGRLVFLPAMKIVHRGGYAASKGLHHVRLFARSGMRFFNTHGWRWI